MKLVLFSLLISSSVYATNSAFLPQDGKPMSVQCSGLDHTQPSAIYQLTAQKPGFFETEFVDGDCNIQIVAHNDVAVEGYGLRITSQKHEPLEAWESDFSNKLSLVGVRGLIECEVLPTK